MVEKAKNKKPSICYYSGTIEDELINSLILLIEAIVSKRTSKQIDVISRLGEVKTQKEVAEYFSLTPSAISQLLKKALYHEVKLVEEQLMNYLKDNSKL